MAKTNEQATVGEIDERFPPTVIHLLKNSQIYISNGCGEYVRFDGEILAIETIRLMLSDKVRAQRNGKEAGGAL